MTYNSIRDEENEGQRVAAFRERAPQITTESLARFLEEGGDIAAAEGRRDMRKWAVEQAVKTGADGDYILEVANRILAYVGADD